MGKKDYVETLRTGLDFVGRVAAKGVTQLSKGIRGDEKDEMETRTSGLYYQRHLVPSFGDFTPKIEYFESVTSNRLVASFVKKLIRSSSDRSFVNACFAMIYGDYDLALEKLAEALASEPQYTDCYFLQGAIYLNQRKFLRAEEAFSKCRLLPTGLGTKIRKFIPTFRLTLCITDAISFTFFPDILGLNLLLAISQRNANKLPQAIANLEQIISVMPNTPELTFFLSAMYYEANWDDKLAEFLKDIIPEDNLEILTVEFLVKTFINKKNLSLAEGILQKSLECEDIDPYIHCDLKALFAEVAKKSGRNAETSAYLQKVAQTIPNYIDLTQRLGLQRRAEPLPKHLIQEILPNTIVETSKPTQVQLPPVSESEQVSSFAPTVLTPPEMLPGEIKSAEPGKIKLKSRDGKVDIILPQSLTIGRESGDLIINWDASASRTHARIFYDKGQIWVEDLGSSNGTWLNQHRISDKRTFNRGDNLLIGKTEFYLE